jgi:hypothetical protein
MNCPAQPYCRLPALAGNRRGNRSLCQAKIRRPPSREVPYTLAVLAAFCGTVAVASWFGVGLTHLGLLRIESVGAPIELGRASSASSRAERLDGPRATAPAGLTSDSAAWSDSLPQPTTPPVLFAAASPTDLVQHAATPTVNFEALDGCVEPDVCIDQFLWSLYERTPKVDTIKVEERVKVKVKNKGKARTVVKTLTKYVTEDFGWKDPKAAQKAGMSLKDYSRSRLFTPIPLKFLREAMADFTLR